MEQQNDDLRNRFTAWMQVVVKRAKIDYIRQVSIEDENVRNKLFYKLMESMRVDNTFSFDNRRLEAVYKKLSPQKRRILELLYVHNYTPEEVAGILHCCIRNVYNQRSLILKELRKKMNGEE